MFEFLNGEIIVRGLDIVLFMFIFLMLIVIVYELAKLKSFEEDRMIDNYKKMEEENRILKRSIEIKGK